jgi:hypothetical protein
MARSYRNGGSSPLVPIDNPVFRKQTAKAVPNLAHRYRSDGTVRDIFGSQMGVSFFLSRRRVRERLLPPRVFLRWAAIEMSRSVKDWRRGEN